MNLKNEEKEPFNYIWGRPIDDVVLFRYLGIIELLIIIGISVFAVMHWEDDADAVLNFCVEFGYCWITGVAVMFLVKLIFRKRFTIKANMTTFIELIVCISYISLVIYSLVHWDYEFIKKSILIFCAALGVVSMVSRAVRLVKTTIKTKNKKAESFKVYFLAEVIFFAMFLYIVVYGIIYWDDDDARNMLLSSCAYIGALTLTYSLAATFIMYSRKRNGGIGNDFFMQNEKEIVAMKEAMDALTGKLEETNKKKEELERQLEETNKNKDELCRQLSETNKNRDELEQQLEETNKDKDELEQQLTETNKNKEELEQQLAETSRSKDSLERQLVEQKEELSTAVEINRKKEIRKDTQRREMLQSRAYSMAKARLEEAKPISDKEWRAMEEELDELFGEFKSTLFEAHNLTDLEYRICWLVKMGFKNIEISTLICRAPNAVSLSRKRLYSKITGRDGSASDFDVIIKEM